MPCHAQARGLGDQSYIQLPKRYHAWGRFDNAFQSWTSATAAALIVVKGRAINAITKICNTKNVLTAVRSSS
jgi:hypothetical protein